jgi:hypothetical protein
MKAALLLLISHQICPETAFRIIGTSGNVSSQNAQWQVDKSVEFHGHQVAMLDSCQFSQRKSYILPWVSSGVAVAVL